MPTPISLRDLVGEMQILPSEAHTYVNKVTGEFVSFSNEELDQAELEPAAEEAAGWEAEVLQQAREVLTSDEYVEIPSKFDIHDYNIMWEFSRDFPDPKISASLLEKIRNKGAFRRFKDAVYQYGIEAAWFQFRDQAYKAIAVAWLESNALAYTDDLKQTP